MTATDAGGHTQQKGTRSNYWQGWTNSILTYGGKTMKSIFEKVFDLVSRRKVERLQAEMNRQQAQTDYIAMMTDVEIPTEEEGEQYVV